MKIIREIPKWSSSLGDDEQDGLLRHYFFEDAFEIYTGIKLTFFDYRRFWIIAIPQWSTLERNEHAK